MVILTACSASTAPAPSGGSDETAAPPAASSDSPPGSSSAPPAPSPPSDPRQALRDASLFKNLDFEDVDASGAPAGWTCYCADAPAACKTTTTNAEHGTRSLLLATGCMAVQTTTSFDATKAVRFDYFGTGAVTLPMDSRLFSIKPEAADILYADSIPSSAKGWVAVASRGVLATDGDKSLTLMLRNSEGSLNYPPDGRDLTIDDVIAVQDQPNPVPKVGALLRATQIHKFSYTPGSTPASVYLSLPIDWASQTPLYTELVVTPPEVVDHVSYALENERNWGATITFAAGAPSDAVRVRWDAVLLERSVPSAELPEVFAAESSPDAWLAASPIADASNAGIASTAQALVTPAMTPLDRMLAVIGWTSKAMTGTGDMTGLDATTVFNARVSSCTGYANLAMAMGRAVGVPARHVTNILVEGSQDMHSIDEFYLGPSLGWRRVEPQATWPRVPDDYAVVMRLVLPGDESPTPNRSSVEGPLMSGIPLHWQLETLSGASSFSYSTDTTSNFTDCSFCPSQSLPQADLRDVSADQMKTLFASARAHWQADLAEYAAGGLSSAKMAARRKAQDAKTAADVSAILSALP
jgi:hypothetical protein